MVKKFSFYGLTSTPPETVLPRFLEKLYAQQDVCLVRTTNPDRVKILSQLLWTYRQGSFLPHGCPPDTLDDQPIWLTDGHETLKGAGTLVLVDGARDEQPSLYSRCAFFFCMHNEEEYVAAKAYYSHLRKQYGPRDFWLQTPDNKWEKRSEEELLLS